MSAVCDPGVCWGSLMDEFLLITNPQELYGKKSSNPVDY